MPARHNKFLTLRGSFSFHIFFQKEKEKESSMSPPAV